MTFATGSLNGVQMLDRPSEAVENGLPAGDPDKCLAADWSEYTTKPIDRVKFMDLIVRIVP